MTYIVLKIINTKQMIETTNKQLIITCILVITDQSMWDVNFKTLQ